MKYFKIEEFTCDGAICYDKMNPKLLKMLDQAREISNTPYKLTYKPEIYSPYFKVLNKEVVDSLHSINIQVIPWTVNEVADMRELISIGVDGIITDYPNRIAEVDEE